MTLHTEPEAARLLGLSRLTLKRERQRGHIEYTLLGVRLIRYSQQQLDEYLRRCRRRDVPAPVATPAPPVLGVTRDRGRAAGLVQALAILNRK